MYMNKEVRPDRAFIPGSPPPSGIRAAGDRWMVYAEKFFRYEGEEDNHLFSVEDSYEEAIAACKLIVDLSLRAARDTRAADLFGHYCQFGWDAFIVGPPGNPVFDARGYARQRCQAMIEGRPRPQAAERCEVEPILRGEAPSPLPQAALTES